MATKKRARKSTKRKAPAKKSNPPLSRKKPQGWIKATRIKFVKGGVLVQKPKPKKRRK